MRSRQQFFWILVSAAIIAALLISTALCDGKKIASGKEQKFTKKDLPASVLTAFETAYPKAAIKEVCKETDSSATIYEIESTDGGMKRTVSYWADGKIEEIEDAVSLKDLPQAAQQSIAKNYPKGEVENVEKVTKKDVVTFEALVVNGEERIEVVFDSSGKLVKSEKKAANEDEQD